MKAGIVFAGNEKGQKQMRTPSSLGIDLAVFGEVGEKTAKMGTGKERQRERKAQD